MSKFYQYINEKKTKFTGRPSTDKMLKQMEQWKSDLRKITKIYRSLEVPEHGDQRELKKWKEFKDIAIKFNENFKEWAFEYILDPKKEQGKEDWDEREFRQKAWQAYINFTIPDLLPEKWDFRENKHVYDARDIIEKRDKIINKYNRYFREAFKAFDELIKNEAGMIERINKLKEFNYGGVNIKIKGEPSKFIAKSVNEFITRLKDFIGNLKSKGFDGLTEGLRIVLNFIEDTTSTAAQYDLGKDELIFYSWGVLKSAEGNLYHEIGHRLYHKFLSDRAETWGWNNFINDAKIKITEDHVTNFIDKFYEILKDTTSPRKRDDSFNFDNEDWLKEFLSKNNVNIDLVGIYQSLFHAYMAEVFGRSEKKLSKDQIYEMLKDQIGRKVNKYYITNYSDKNADEAFAETFRLYMLGKFSRLHPIVKEVFKNVVNSSKFKIEESESKEENKNKKLWDFLNT